MSDPDIPLVEACLAGDPEAFGTLVERYQNRITAHLRRLVGPVDALDLAQESFLRAWRKLHLFDAHQRFLPWILTLATRLALTHLRRSDRMLPLLDDEVSTIVASPLPPTSSADPQERLARLEAALDRLSPTNRALFELRFRQQLSIEELSAHFELNAGAVKVRVHRLRQALQAALGPEHSHAH